MKKLLAIVFLLGCASGSPNGASPWRYTGESGFVGNKYIRQELWCTLEPGGDGGSWCSARGGGLWKIEESTGFNNDCEMGLDVDRTSPWLHPKEDVTEDEARPYLSNFNLGWEQEGLDGTLMTVHVDKPERGKVYGYVQCETTQ